jgi:TonB-linked SusC/RagA family outer membrane protein
MQHPIRSGPPRPRAAGPGPGRLAAALALAAAALCAAPAAAQDGEVAGTVTAAQSQRPLAGAQVEVQGTARRVVTDAAGRFRIGALTGTDVTLRVTTLGYQSATRAARVGDTDVRISLAETAVSIDALVVTGTPGATQRRSLGNAVGTIDAARVVEEAQVNNVQQLLNGRAPGVVIQPASGGVGTGSRIRIRGASSFSLSNEPLIYVDGVRVNNTPASGPANQAFGSASISRINDINPEDIASIEVLRGPAAATLYGTEAANGVIQIITKRGAAGKTAWNLVVKQGANYFANPEGRLWRNFQLDTLTGSPTRGQIVSIDIVERQNSLGDPIFRTGHHQEYDLSLSGGSDRFRYFAAGGLEDSKGAEDPNDLTRWNARTNLSIAPSSKMDIDVGLSWVDGRTNLSPEAGYGGYVYSSVLADPRSLTGRNSARRGFHSGTPEQYLLLYQIWQDLNRFTGSLQVNHRTFSWLSQRLSFGADFTREQDVEFTPRVDSLRSSVFGDEALGYKGVTNRDIRYRTVDYSATATVDVNSDLTSRSTLGAQYYKTSRAFIFAEGTEFPAPGLSSVNATVRDRFNDEDASDEVTMGVFGQEQLGWKDRLFVTAGLRVDDNSAFGSNFDLVYYPKLSASWVLSEEPFFSVPFVNTLLLRGAYGESGKAPVTFSALRTYQPVAGPNDASAVTPLLIGNADLGPERGKELELGLDAGFLDDRLGLELTWYRKTTVDAILQRDIAPSLGFPGTQFFNAGEVRNSGVEALVRGRPLEREKVGLELTFSVATNSNEVVDLGLGDLTTVSAGTFLEHREGYPIGSYFEQKVTSATLTPAGVATNVMCDNGSGGETLCAGADGTFGTADDAPNVFLGRSLPKVEGAFTSTLTLFSNLRLYGMLDFKRGQRKVDGNTRVRCTFFGGRCRENFFPLEFAPERIAQVQSNNNLVDFLVADASFAKLREVSVTYTLPDALTRRLHTGRASVSLAGRNLHTWTDYPGLEPEAMFLGGTRGGNFGAFEQTTLPQLTQWVASVNLSF